MALATVVWLSVVTTACATVMVLDVASERSREMPSGCPVSLKATVLVKARAPAQEQTTMARMMA